MKYSLTRSLISWGLFLFALTPFLTANAADYRGRLGVGLSNQLMNDLPAISFKLQKSRAVSMGAVINASNHATNGGYGAGLKLYRNIFDEPQLTFYGALLGAYIDRKTTDKKDKTGFQFDLTMGSEFCFSGLQSLGFSFEFGVSFNKMTDFVVETVGHNFITAAVHFYL
ncbi:MAG: hypothetical protein WCG27_08110 [Pseudomonadota bacterium]